MHLLIVFIAEDFFEEFLHELLIPVPNRSLFQSSRRDERLLRGALVLDLHGATYHMEVFMKALAT